MKFGVSKILPNSISKISKWLSPKVDGNSRRRRHDEIDSEDEADSPPSQQTLPIQQRTGGNHQMGGVSVPPPSKKQRTFTVCILNAGLFSTKFLKIAKSYKNPFLSLTVVFESKSI